MALAGGRLIRLRRRAEPAPSPADLVAALPVPMLVVDSAGEMVEANPAAETLLNRSRAAIVGERVAALIGDALAGADPGAPLAAYDVELGWPGARRQRVDLIAAPLGERAGWRVLTLHGHATAAPIARRTGREGSLRTAIGAAATLAHEIKNPLSGIRGAAQLLDSGVDEEARGLTRLIRDEVDRITALIDRMEGFTDTRALVLGPQNIHAILGHAREVATQGFAAGIAIRELYDPSLPPVRGNRDALVQIMINLLKNAAEALDHKGSITLTTSYRHGMGLSGEDGQARRSLPIEVCVIDDGPGAPDAIAQHLFDPFVTTKPTGSGLGLALVEKLVHDQGGMVEYAREGDPARTVFRLLLPREP